MAISSFAASLFELQQGQWRVELSGVRIPFPCFLFLFLHLNSTRSVEISPPSLDGPEHVPSTKPMACLQPCLLPVKAPDEHTHLHPFGTGTGGLRLSCFILLASGYIARAIIPPPSPPPPMQKKLFICITNTYIYRHNTDWKICPQVMGKKNG